MKKMQQKRTRKPIFRHHMDLFKTDFVCHFIIMGENWVYQHNPQLKQERIRWTEAGYLAPKQTKHERSANQVMASAFWDAKGILLVDYLEKGETINSTYYCNFLDQLDAKIYEAGVEAQINYLSLRQRSLKWKNTQWLN